METSGLPPVLVYDRMHRSPSRIPVSLVPAHLAAHYGHDRHLTVDRGLAALVAPVPGPESGPQNERQWVRPNIGSHLLALILWTAFRPPNKNQPQDSAADENDTQGNSHSARTAAQKRASRPIREPRHPDPEPACPRHRTKTIAHTS